jgi:hypothetical protein
MDYITPHEEELGKAHGWYSHFILPENTAQRWVNYHTHGLPEHYGHLDFQFVLPIDPNILHALATKLVDRVTRGERFAAGMRVSGVMEDYDVFLMKTAETRRDNRVVLRVILPDRNGNIDKADLNGIFAAQFEELPK